MSVLIISITFHNKIASELVEGRTWFNSGGGKQANLIAVHDFEAFVWEKQNHSNPKWPIRAVVR